MTAQSRPSDRELIPALEAAIGERGEGRIATMQRRPSLYSSSYPIEELDVELTGGKRLALVFKDCSRAAMLPESRAAKPEFLYDPLREIEVYRTVLERSGLETPHFHAAVIDPAKDRYWLFIERIGGVELYQVGEIDVWERSARWAASLHRCFPDQTVPSETKSHLIQIDGDYLGRWVSRAVRFCDSVAMSKSSRQGLRSFAGRYEVVLKELAALPRSFIHGEYYASNILIVSGADHVRIAPIDWEMSAIGPSLLDLAALVSGKWSEPQRKVIASAYRDAMAGSDFAVKDFGRALDLCRLQVAIGWLGWSESWKPPAAHAQDWLQEALGLAGSLDII
jgi:hypothetical protein